jgi:hypothetical protein
MKAIRAITFSLAIVLLALEVLFSVMVVVASFHGGDFRTGTIYTVVLFAQVLAARALLNPRPMHCNAAMRLRFQFEDPWRGVGDLRR